MVLLLLACGGDDDATLDAGGDVGAGEDAGLDSAPADDVPTAGCDLDDVVTFLTSDGVQLEAFAQLAGPDAPAVVLFHMVPPSNNRSNYSAAFRNELFSNGWSVLNVDRRGAGGSDGVAREAYEGPGGALDVAAATEFLRGTGCVDMTKVAIIGASNGTTSVLDGIVAGGIEPATVVFLSGGSYTVNQNPIDTPALATLPVLFAWSDGDTPSATWNVGVRDGRPGEWLFNNRAGDAHGTMLLADDDARGAVIAWLFASLR